MSNEDKSYKTAITRTKPSAPTKWLKKNGYLRGKILDYGCGKGFDCTWLECDGYDPYYKPETPTGKYDTILCNYVLNVISSCEVRQQVLDIIQNLLALDGTAYVAVRRGSGLNGYTKICTYQTTIKLKLPVFHETSSYAIYEMGA